jgi:hypothetical protein
MEFIGFLIIFGNIIRMCLFYSIFAAFLLIIFLSPGLLIWLWCISKKYVRIFVLIPIFPLILYGVIASFIYLMKFMIAFKL